MMSEYNPNETLGGLPAPHGWYILERIKDYGLAWRRTIGESLTVIESTAVKDDGRMWLHVSLSKPNSKKIPSYEDIQLLRKLFIGEDRECYLIFPPKARYINIHPGVIHLWACLYEPDGVLPHMEGDIGGMLSI